MPAVDRLRRDEQGAQQEAVVDRPLLHATFLLTGVDLTGTK